MCRYRGRGGGEGRVCVTCGNEEGRPEVMFFGYFEGEEFRVCTRCLARALNWRTLPRLRPIWMGPEGEGVPTLRWGWDRRRG
jgi:hypothetical protein